MVFIICVLHKPITIHSVYIVQVLVGHGKSRFLGKDESCESTLAIYMNYLPMLQSKLLLSVNQSQRKQPTLLLRSNT